MNFQKRDSESLRLSERDWLSIREALVGIRFGVVVVTLQDGVLVQVERKVKRRTRDKSHAPPLNVSRLNPK